MKIRKVTKAELDEIEFAQFETCSHSCGKCGKVEQHNVPFGPMLEPICHARIFITCMKCKKPPTKEEIESIQDKDIVKAIRDVERRFTRLKERK